jgi:hypothetical protein
MKLLMDIIKTRNHPKAHWKLDNIRTQILAAELLPFSRGNKCFYDMS